MSLVYRAIDIRTGHSVAVKILKSEYNTDKEFLERFQREAKAASLMNHHNLVNLLDVGVEGEYRYLVLEYVNGHTLKEIIQQKGRLNYKTAIQIAIRILSALQHAHDNGIVHRDIKPQNILIHTDGRVKVSDFGIARMTNSFTISKGDKVIGSVHYSSPEQASGGLVEAPSDLYSTGVVLYEMLTGRVPFVGETPVSVAMQHVKDAPPSIRDFAPETPASVIAIVMKAMEKSPVRRFQSAREMADALKKAYDGTLQPSDLQVSPEMFKPQPKPQPEEKPVEPKPEKPVKPAKQQVKPNITNITIQKARRKVLIRTLLTTTGALVILAAVTLGILLAFGVLGRVSAPYIIDLETKEAQMNVEAAGLVWAEEHETSEIIPAGHVIRQEPEAEADMHRGDTLTAVISTGVTNGSVVPNLTGYTYETAISLLKDLGITDITLVKMVSTMPTSTVISQNPLPDTDISGITAMELTISGGSTLIPNVTGHTREEATAMLTEAGLVTGTISYIEVTGEQIGIVAAQSPTSGSTAVLGAAVSLTVGVETQPYKTNVSLKLPKADEDRILKIVLVVANIEYLKYQTVLMAGMDVDTVIPLNSATSGDLLARIYLNDKLYNQFLVTLE